MTNDLNVSDLKIKGKRGPFKLKQLNYDQLMEAMTSVKSDDTTDMILRWAQFCLYNGQDKPVYNVDQIDKMKEEVMPGATLITLGRMAMKLNKVDELIGLADKVEDAQKN